MLLHPKKEGGYLKRKFKLTLTDLTDLDATLFNSVIDINDTLTHQKTEINMYRLHFVINLRNKIHNKVNRHDGKKSTLSFSQVEILALRYCLLQRRKTPGMNELFIKLDATIHPTMYERT